MEPIRIIMSGAVVEQELAAEFGPLPPAFLPVGMRRLYELQLANFARGAPVHMVLPEGFDLSEFDRARLTRLGVEVIPIPDGLRLGEAVVHAINYVGRPDAPVRILHGDTLVRPPADADGDLILGADHSSEYAWAEIELEGGRVTALATVPAGEDGAGRPIAAGYFQFSSSLDLVRCVTRARGDFIAGLNLYLQHHVVRMAPATCWLDFGHVQTFYQSRLAVSTARAFNSVRLDGLTAAKRSADCEKMMAEAAWLKRAPAEIQPYCARVVATGQSQGWAFYKTEYEHLPLLAELYVYGAVGRAPWRRILESCETFLSLCARRTTEEMSGADAFRRLGADKTLARLEIYARQSGFDIDRPLAYRGRPTPSLRSIAERLGREVDAAGARPACVMHGDFCFSNILYSPRLARIRVIDPRGSVDGPPTLFGDTRYDLAKLAHSITGRYDQIIAGRYAASEAHGDYAIAFARAPHQAWLEDALGDLTVEGVRADDPGVRAASAGLFLSMLPLHADRPDRQTAFIANALRLFSALDAR